MSEEICPYCKEKHRRNRPLEEQWNFVKGEWYMGCSTCGYPKYGRIQELKQIRGINFVYSEKKRTWQ